MRRIRRISIIVLSAASLLGAGRGVAQEAAAPDDSVRVLQNRYFLKAMRPELSLFGGMVLNESYSDTYTYGARAGMFLTELVGLEYAFGMYKALDSPDLKALKKSQVCVGNVCKGIEPSFSRLKLAHSLSLTLAPVYGKVNLLDLAIIYSDINFSAGAAYLKIDQYKPAALSFARASKVAPLLGVGQRFYFGKSFSARIDASDYIYLEERENLGQVKKGTRHAWTVTVGLSAFLFGGQ